MLVGRISKLKFMSQMVSEALLHTFTNLEIMDMKK